MGYRITVDTGGTFTAVVVSADTHRQVMGKALTTPTRVFDGLRASLSVAAKRLDTTLDRRLAGADFLIYGTTRATNAIVKKKTARTAFLTTAGFPDILLFRECGRFDVHDNTLEIPAPYISRHDTFEIGGRIDSQGDVIAPLNEPAVAAAACATRTRDLYQVASVWSDEAADWHVDEAVTAALRRDR